MHVCLFLTLLWLHAADQPALLFVHATTVNLRSEPTPTAPIVHQVAIGHECQTLEVGTDDWVKVRCDLKREKPSLRPMAKEGWVKRELLAETAPRFEPFSKAAADEALPLADRLTQASRALALKPKDEQAQKRFLNLFTTIELARLDETRAAGKVSKRATQLDCADGNESCFEQVVSKVTSESLTRDQNDVWTHTVRRKNDILIISLWSAGDLTVTQGRLADIDYKVFYSPKVVIEMQYLTHSANLWAAAFGDGLTASLRCAGSLALDDPADLDIGDDCTSCGDEVRPRYKKCSTPYFQCREEGYQEDRELRARCMEACTICWSLCTTTACACQNAATCIESAPKQKHSLDTCGPIYEKCMQKGRER